MHILKAFLILSIFASYNQLGASTVNIVDGYAQLDDCLKNLMAENLFSHPLQSNRPTKPIRPTVPFIPRESTLAPEFYNQLLTLLTNQKPGYLQTFKNLMNMHQVNPYQILPNNRTLFSTACVADPTGEAAEFLLKRGVNPIYHTRDYVSSVTELLQDGQTVDPYVWEIIFTYIDVRPSDFEPYAHPEDDSVFHLATNAAINRMMKGAFKAKNYGLIQFLIQEEGVFGYLEESPFEYDPLLGRAFGEPEKTSSDLGHGLFVKEILLSSHIPLIKSVLQAGVRPLTPLVVLVENSQATTKLSPMEIAIQYSLPMTVFETLYNQLSDQEKVKGVTRAVLKAAELAAREKGRPQYKEFLKSKYDFIKSKKT